jgi:formate dehydrogenase major subunit
MTVSRRDFLRASAGTALGGLAALGVDLTPATARAEKLRIRDARIHPSVCPYCAVGCGTLVYSARAASPGESDEILHLEGDVRSPVNQGALCPKGAAILALHKNPNRAQKVLHRAPFATTWEEWDLERAMDRVAELVKKTRDETFVERGPDGKTYNHTLGIFSLGGATMDNEWNHVHQKLMRGLGVVAIENQARI